MERAMKHGPFGPDQREQKRQELQEKIFLATATTAELRAIHDKLIDDLKTRGRGYCENAESRSWVDTARQLAKVRKALGLNK